MKTNRVIERIAIVVATSITTGLLLRLKNKFIDDGNDNYTCDIIKKGVLTFKDQETEVIGDMCVYLKDLARQISGASPNCKVVVQGNGSTNRPLCLERISNIIECLHRDFKIDPKYFVIVVGCVGGENDINFRAATYKEFDV